MEDLNITVKFSNGEKFSILIPSDLTVAQAKEKFEATCKVPANQQRLIYRGRILKDPELLTSYGIATGHIIHLVKIKTEPSQPSGGNTEASSASNTTAPNTASQANFGDSSTRPNFNDLGQLLSNAGAARGANPAAGFLGDNADFNPQLFQNLISNPAFMSVLQELSQNPEFLRNMIQSNSLFNTAANQNPMLQAMLNNPELLRSTLNPEILQTLLQGSQGSQTAGGNPNGTANVNGADWQTLFNSAFAQRNDNSGASGANVDPAVRFGPQLRQLEDMGFIDKDANLMALQRTGGDVTQAVTWLLDAEQTH